jgi:hypothetical protein
MTCQVGGTVSLAGYENIAVVNGGAGDITGVVACEGSVAGAGTITGHFTFCKHSATGHTSECTSPPDQNPEEPLWDGLGATSLIAHVQANMSFTFLTGGGCSFGLEGHTLGVIADLVLTGFSCNSGAFTGEVTRSQAEAIPVIVPGGLVAGIDCEAGPGGTKTCFKDLAISGVIEAISTS